MYLSSHAFCLTYLNSSSFPFIQHWSALTWNMSFLPRVWLLEWWNGKALKGKFVFPTRPRLGGDSTIVSTRYNGSFHFSVGELFTQAPCSGFEDTFWSAAADNSSWMERKSLIPYGSRKKHQAIIVEASSIDILKMRLEPILSAVLPHPNKFLNQLSF